MERMSKNESSRFRQEVAASALRGETSEMDTSCITAFGIKLVSRSGRSDEMAEMLCFAKAIALENLAGVIEGVLYADGCAHLRPCFPLDLMARDQLRKIARSTLSNYDMGSGPLIGIDPNAPY